MADSPPDDRDPPLTEPDADSGRKPLPLRYRHHVGVWVPTWLRALLLCVLLPLITIVSMKLAADSEVAAIVASCMAAAAYWYAFDRASPPLVGIVLILVSLPAYYLLSELAVLWVMASALAGATGAWLGRQQGREEDFYFLPAAAALAAFIILVWLGWGGQVEEPLSQLRNLPGRWLAVMEQEMTRVRESGQNPPLADQEMQLLRDYLPRLLVPSLMALWVFGLWIAGRLVRRATGRFHAPRNLFVLFRLGQRYIFVLIAGLFFAILGSLYAWPTAWGIAFSLLAVMYVAALVQGIAVLLFMAAVRRKMGQPGFATALTIGGLVLFIGFIQVPVGALLGLMDVWIDFRRLDRRTVSGA